MKSHRSAISPRLTLALPKSKLNFRENEERLPSIRDRNSPDLERSPFLASSTNEPVSSKPLTTKLNFFEIKKTIDQKKLDLVKHTLNNKKQKEFPQIFLNFEKNNESHESLIKSVPERRSLKAEPLSPNLFFHDKTISPFKIDESNDLLLNIPEVVIENYENSIEAKEKSNVYTKPPETFDLFEGSEGRHQAKPNDETEISKLTKENFMLEKSLGNANIRIKKLKEIQKKVTEEFKNTKQKSQELLLKNEIQIKYLKKELQEREQELFQTQESLKISEKNRKFYSESIQKYEFEAKKLSQNEANLLQTLKETESKAISFQKCFEDEKLKNLSLANDFNSKFEENENLSVEILNLSALIQKDKLLISELTKKIENARINWSDKDKEYQKIIQDLLSQVTIEKELKQMHVSETCKYKKALNLISINEISNFTKEEVLRCQQKINERDQSIISCKLEVERLTKNIEYYKYLLNSKQEIISILEAQQVKLLQPDFSMPEFIEYFKTAFKSFLICQKCKKNPCSFVVGICSHRICITCEIHNQECPVCGIPSAFSLNKYFNSFQEISKLLQQITPESLI